MTSSCSVTDTPAEPVLHLSAGIGRNPEGEAGELDRVRALMTRSLGHVIPGPAREAASWQLATGGSLLRARLALASGVAFRCPQSYRIAAAAACELVHNASLVHDDLCDGDCERRGQATIWKQFGEGVALCTGDLLLCAAFGVAAELEDAHQSRMLSQQLATLTSRVIVGQSLEIAPASEATTAGLRSYLEATRAKTAPLIELPLMTGAVAGDADAVTLEHIRQLAAAMGLAYQIIDDLDDLREVDGPATAFPQLHRFHAWHHHRIRGRDSPQRRMQCATRHALAALGRGRRELEHLEQRLPGPLTETVQPLLGNLETRALAHRQHLWIVGGSWNHDDSITR